MTIQESTVNVVQGRRQQRDAAPAGRPCWGLSLRPRASGSERSSSRIPAWGRKPRP